MAPLSLERALMAVEKVRERLLRSTAALERHGVRYAVIGGHAVAVWIARVDEDAVRNTVDVDILLDRKDLPKATAALNEVGFEFAEVQGVPVFVEKISPKIRRGVHIIFAAEKVRPHERHPAPDFSKIDRAEDGFTVIDLLPLLVMKLTAFRRKDQVHLQDMLELEMITPELEAQLPPDLRARLGQIRATPE
ncbi:MAG TPA: hypothetical protein VJZ71_09905 [Phycisphaerae bacterium]|nr:hypothetical protein [Phycisphaerae bacterium]